MFLRQIKGWSCCRVVPPPRQAVGGLFSSRWNFKSELIYLLFPLNTLGLFDCWGIFFFEYKGEGLGVLKSRSGVWLKEQKTEKNQIKLIVFTERPASLLCLFIAERASGRFSLASANSLDTSTPNSASSLQPPHFHPSPGGPLWWESQPHMVDVPSAQERVTAKATPAEAMAWTNADSLVAKADKRRQTEGVGGGGGEKSGGRVSISCTNLDRNDVLLLPTSRQMGSLQAITF